ncbi:MAG: amidase [Acidimicrobiia bacterium]|nr:amidase [Acidimicrobiia bacterium]
MSEESAVEESAVELAESVRAGERSAEELLDRALAAIAEVEPALNAWAVIDEGLAREAARAVDAAVASGHDPGPLAGVPFGVKDLEDCAGLTTGHGSLLYRDHPPATSDSVHVARMRAAGAVPVGKTTAPEFGTLSLTRNKSTGVTRNPWNPERTPGGSSGGSAAAVAAGTLPLATASDGGGSIRIPASFSGLFGFKASHGRVPHPAPHASQTAVLGVVTTTVRDAARHLDVAAGPDDTDRLSLPPPSTRYEDAIETFDVGGLRVAWSLDLGFAVVDPEVADITRAAAEVLISAADLERVERTPALTDPVRVWTSSGAPDLWLDLEPDMWPSVADDVTLHVRRSFEQTESFTLPRYARVLERRQQLQRDMAAMYADVDVWLTPTTAVAAFAAEGPPPKEIAGVEVGPAMATPFTMLSNLTGGPACSVPAGFTSEGLPVGLQIMGRRHADEVVLRLARIFEQSQPWPRWAPSAGGGNER